MAVDGVEISRRGFVGSVGLAMAAGVAVPGWAWASAACDDHDGATGEQAKTYFEWSEVRPGVWVAIGGGGNVLACAPEGGGRRRGLVVDTKNGGLGRILKGEAEALLGEPIWAGINTHHHPDHVGGNSVFTAARVFAHPRAQARVRAMNRILRDQVFRTTDAVMGDASWSEEIRAWARQERKSMDLLDAEDFVPTHAMGAVGAVGRLPIVPDLPVEVRHFGAGHTDSDVVLRFENDNVLHVGDLVFNGLHPFFDADGGATVRGWVESLRECETLCDAETVVVPGHGLVGDVEIIRGQIGYLESLIEAVREEIEAGVPIEAAAEKSWAFMDGLGFERIRPRAIAGVYAELEREGGD